MNSIYVISKDGESPYKVGIQFGLIENLMKRYTEIPNLKIHCYITSAHASYIGNLFKDKNSNHQVSEWFNMPLNTIFIQLQL